MKGVLDFSTYFHALLSTILLIALAGCDSLMYDDGRFKPSANEQDVYIQGKDKYDVLIATDEVGVVLREEAAAQGKRAINTIEDYGLKFRAFVTDNLLIFHVPEASRREHIVDLARALRTSEPNTIQTAGFVMRFPDAKSPFVVTDDIVIQYAEIASPKSIADLHIRIGVKVLMPNPFVENQFLVRVTPENKRDALAVANDLNEHPLVEYAHPDFYREVVARQFIPNDTYFPNQWHLNNTGQGAGTVDADIDAPQAWDFTLGNANRNVVVAVIDGGFDAAHPDLTPNLWVNPGEIAGDGVDNDNNGFVDDLHGWDFAPCGAIPGAGCGDNTLAGGRHGTAVAGAVAARGNNALGVSGSCPNCQMILIRRSGGAANEFQHALAFGYARQMGAEIITNSWGYAIGTPATANVEAAINNAANIGRNGLGSVVFFAMHNEDVDDCGAVPDISSLADVIAVSRSTNLDRFDNSGFGDCMDILCTSTSRAQPTPARGTLQGMTTDEQGANGYNTGAGAACLSGNDPTAPPANALDYTYCFDGTSFAAPVAAGAAGLVLSLDGTPTRLQVQRLLQDTADKTEHSLANYDTETGFSNGGTPGTLATHGYGRVNAFEAVRIAAPAADNGLGGVDIFLRDNALDWGNTEQRSNVTFEPVRGFIGHYRSVDIKIDAPPFQVPPTDSANFAALTDEQAKVGMANRVYVRVRNRGFRTANNVKVKLLWTQFGTALPNFPNATIWSDFTNTATAVGDWNQLGVQTKGTLGYSGASIANTINDQAEIFRFNNFSPTFDASKPNHFCLFAVATSNEDPVASTTLIPDEATPTDNNVTHRNVQVNLSSRDDERLGGRFYVRNPFDFPIRSVLDVVTPKGWKSWLNEPFVIGKPITLKPKESILVKLNVVARKKGTGGEVSVTQYRLDRKEGRVVIGGAVFEYKSEQDILIEQPMVWLERYYQKLFKKKRF
ncbi:MAG: S8 family serine peptidase [Planctomycetota bacterium]|jgi:subtilisin family serine protease